MKDRIFAKSLGRVFFSMFGVSVWAPNNLPFRCLETKPGGASFTKRDALKSRNFPIVMEGLEDLSPPGVPGPDTTMEASKQRWYKLLRNPRRRRAATPWIV